MPVRRGLCRARARAQTPKTQREKLGYALGAEIGEAFKEKGVEFDLAAFNAGVRDTMTGNRPQMTVSQRQEMLMSLNKGRCNLPGQAAGGRFGGRRTRTSRKAMRSWPRTVPSPECRRCRAACSTR